MSARIRWNLLILFGVLCQGIIGTLSEKDNGESSDLLVREKRVINRSPGGDSRVTIRYAPYVAIIREFNRSKYCPGSILSVNIVLTAAKCVYSPNDMYRIHVGTSRLTLSGTYVTHSIADKKIYTNTHRLREQDGVALILVAPAFTFSAYTRSIPLYTGPLPAGALVSVLGWGCHEVEPHGTQYPDHLRRITVPVINVRECEQIYQNIFPITNADICTLDRSGDRYCSYRDTGAPLIIEANGSEQLAGIHLWNGAVVGRNNPDVYINLQSNEYRTWIQRNIQILEHNAHHG